MLSMQRPSPRVVTDSKVMEKTHQRGPKEVEWLSQVAAEVEAASSSEAAGLVVRRYFDLDSLINITAMNYALGAWDTWLNSFNNNYWCAYCSEASYYAASFCCYRCYRYRPLHIYVYCLNL